MSSVSKACVPTTRSRLPASSSAWMPRALAGGGPVREQCDRQRAHSADPGRVARPRARSRKLAGGQEVLLGQHLGRDHEGALVPALHAVEERRERDDGLARADVALQQAVHRMRGAEVGGHLPDRSFLGRRSAGRAGVRGTPRRGSACRVAA